MVGVWRGQCTSCGRMPTLFVGMRSDISSSGTSCFASLYKNRFKYFLGSLNAALRNPGLVKTKIASR